MKRTISILIACMALFVLFTVGASASGSAARCEINKHKWTHSIQHGKSDVITFVCTVCGAQYSVDLEGETLDPCTKEEHIWHSYIIGSDCTKREMEFDCVNEGCSTMVIVQLPRSEQIEHRFVKEQAEPTCTRQGYVRYKCTNPGCTRMYYEKRTPALGHDRSVANYAKLFKKADCTHNAQYIRSCLRCGALYSKKTYDPKLMWTTYDYILDEKPGTALGHRDLKAVTSQKAFRSEGVNGGAPTYYYTCGKCGAVDKEAGYFYGKSEQIPVGEFFAGDIIQLGAYPQSRVTDEALLSAFDALNVPMKSYGFTQFNTHNTADITYGDFEYAGQRYRKVIIGEAQFTNVLRDKVIFHGESMVGTFYFLWEPLNWKVVRVTAESSLLVCCNIIDFMSLHTSADFAKYIDNDPWLIEYYGANYRDGIYTGDMDTFLEEIHPTFGYSSLRTRLNEDFLNDAFEASQVSHFISTIDKDRVFVLDRNTLVEKRVKKVLEENGSYRAPVSDYALTLRPDYSGNAVSKGSGIYYVDGVPYAESAITYYNRFGTTCLDSENGMCRYIDKNLMFTPFFGTRPAIELAGDYVPQAYTSLRGSTITGVQSAAGRIYDVNGDNVIDIADVSAILPELGNKANAGKNDDCDVNDDTVIDIQDVCEVLVDYCFGQTVR